MNLTSDLYQTLAQASCDCEAIGNAWVFQCHQRGEGWGGVERSVFVEAARWESLQSWAI